MEMMDYANALNLLNVLLSLGLLYIYLRNYRVVKSVFSLGLMFFASMILVQNAAALYFQTMMIDYYSMEVAGFAFILTALQAVGLAVLLYVTWKPQ